MSGPEQEHWLVREVTIRRLWIAFIAILTGLVVADLFAAHHPHFRLESWFGFSAWFGFLSCVVLVAFAKALGMFLKRPDTYYDS